MGGKIIFTLPLGDVPAGRDGVGSVKGAGEASVLPSKHCGQAAPMAVCSFRSKGGGGPGGRTVVIPSFSRKIHKINFWPKKCNRNCEPRSSFNYSSAKLVRGGIYDLAVSALHIPLTQWKLAGAKIANPGRETEMGYQCPSGIPVPLREGVCEGLQKCT